MATKRMILTIALGLAGIALWWGVVQASSPQDSGSLETLSGDTATSARGFAGRVLPVETLTLTAANSYRTEREYSGEVVARRQSTLSFEVPGKVLRMLVDEGDRIEPSQPLAHLDRRRLDAERARLAALRDAAHAVLDEMVAGPRKEEIDRARADLAQWQAQHDRFEQRAGRLKGLLGRKAVAVDDVDAVIYLQVGASARVDAAKHRLDELLAGTRPEKVRTQEATVESYRAQIMALDIDLDNTQLVAPFAGRVSLRHVDEGTVVSPGQAVLEIVEDRVLEVRVGLPVAAAAHIHAGENGSLKIAGRTYEATVAGILPQLDRKTRTVEVIYRIDADDGPVVPGQMARVALSQLVETRGFWVPTSALVKAHRGLWSVYVVVSDAEGDSGGEMTVRHSDVEVLYHRGSMAFVRGAIKDHQLIVATGVDRIVSGQAIRPSGPIARSVSVALDQGSQS